MEWVISIGLCLFAISLFVSAYSCISALKEMKTEIEETSYLADSPIEACRLALDDLHNGVPFETVESRLRNFFDGMVTEVTIYQAVHSDGMMTHISFHDSDPRSPGTFSVIHFPTKVSEQSETPA